MLQAATLHLTYLLLLSAVFLLSGKLLFTFLFRQVRLNGRFTRLFLFLLTGCVSWVFLVATFKSRANTIQLLWLIPATALFFRRNLTLRIPSLRQDKKIKPMADYLVAGTCLVVAYAWFAMIFLRNATLPYRPIHDDLLVYAGLSEQLWTCGTENRWIQLLQLSCQAAGAEPYHYFELWLNSAIAQLPGLGYMDSLILVTLPFFLLLSFLAVLALLEYFHPPRIFFFISPFIFFAVSGYLPGIWGQDSVYVTDSPVGVFYEKSLVLYPFAFLCLLLLQRGRRQEAVSALFTLMIVSAAVFPALLLLGLILSILLKNKKLFWTFGGAAVLIIVFYGWNYLKGDQVFSYDLRSWAGHLNWRGEIVEASKILGATLQATSYSQLQILILAIPAFLLRSPLLKLVLILYVLLFFSSFASLFLLKHVSDAQQFFCMPLVVLRASSLLLVMDLMNQGRQNPTTMGVLATMLVVTGCWVLFFAGRSQRILQKKAEDNAAMNARLVEYDMNHGENKYFMVIKPLPFACDVLQACGGSVLWPFSLTGFHPVPIVAGSYSDIADPASQLLHHYTPWGRLKDKGLSDSTALGMIIGEYNPHCILLAENNPLLPTIRSNRYQVFAGPRSGTVLLLAKTP